MQHGRVNATLGITTREQLVHRASQAPVGSQDPEQLRQEHDIAVAATLALLDADNHPAAVDVADLEAGHLGGAQAGRIRGGQRSAALQAVSAGEYPQVCRLNFPQVSGA